MDAGENGGAPDNGGGSVPQPLKQGKRGELGMTGRACPVFTNFLGALKGRLSSPCDLPYKPEGRRDSLNQAYFPAWDGLRGSWASLKNW